MEIPKLKACFTLLAVVLTTLCEAQNTYEITNLGTAVNSAYSDINPVVSADGKSLYFIRSNHPENFNSENGESQDIWVSEKDEAGNWKPAVHLDKSLNRQQFNTVFNVSHGGNRLLIGGSYVNEVFWGLGFSFVDRKDGQWGEPHELSIKNFDKMCLGFSASAYLVNTNQTLLLAFSEEEGSKLNDLYVSKQLPNGKWSQPLALGKSINTPNYDESTPFMAADGVTLYFSSNRPGGYGQNDIYLTRRLDDTWQNWSEPVNLGPQINTEQWDAYYTIPASGNVAYMVSYKNTHGKADIVEIKLSKDKPEPVALLAGKVLNSKTNEPVEAQIIYEVLPSGNEAGKTSFWSKSGDFKLVLPYGKNYGVSARASGYVPVSVNIDLTKTGDYKEITRNLMLVPIETGQVIRLNNIFFAEYSDTLQEISIPELNRLVRLMKENNSMSIEIAGHTDAVGSDAENQLLSEKRANAVKNYLVKKGIKAGRLFSIGYGESQPIADNNNDVDRQQNRRVEFKILKK